MIYAVPQKTKSFMCDRYSYTICSHAVCPSAGGTNEATQKAMAAHWSRLKFEKNISSFDEPLVDHVLWLTS